ncbi:MAG TPA: type II toxin-antitoxin system prevent-host-death family antitoxin [Stellaceae bacterium]|nr:type II toxin-antitoxin system prevent-host-death family antitoxin [Stellaceae bacterium]
MQMSIARAKAEFAALVAQAESDQEVVITRNGRPVARMVPLAASGKVTYGDLRGLKLPDDLSLPQDALDAFYSTDKP